ncbi:MAG TPA: DUF4349 domain-containing protein [Patescibacteria group bacterium]|nr:DUF4349 domain-containing protein [Patescibacteria group bacterium]
MDERTDRPRAFIVAGLLIAAALVLGSTFLGGQVSTVLSTVGAAIPGRPASGAGVEGTGLAATRPTPTRGPAADAAALPPPDLLIVRTGTLDIEVGDLDATIRAADAAVTRVGGYVDGSNRAAGGDDAVAVVTYRIPSDAWGATLDHIRAFARKVHSEQITTEEVTGQVVDLGARIANLRTTEAALQGIMAKATVIKDILAVQAQLTETRGEIERLVASQADLADRAAYGSLTVSFRLPARIEPSPTPVASPGWNPGADVEKATGQLVSIGQATTSLGIWLGIVGLPLLLAGCVIVFVSLQLVRLARWIVARRDPTADPAG